MRLETASGDLPRDAPGDTELVAALLRKDRKASAEFVSRFADPVYGYIRWRLAPASDAVEDLVQEVFLEAWRSLAAFRGDGGLQAWIMAIARHRVQDYYRKRLRELPDDPNSPEPPEPAGLEHSLLQQHDHAVVHRVLEQLPEIYRLVLLWRYWEGRRGAEIAREIGRSEKAVERLLARARDLFRKTYEDLAR